MWSFYFLQSLIGIIIFLTYSVIDFRALLPFSFLFISTTKIIVFFRSYFLDYYLSLLFFLLSSTYQNIRVVLLIQNVDRKSQIFPKGCTLAGVRETCTIWYLTFLKSPLSKKKISYRKITFKIVI